MSSNEMDHDGSTSYHCISSNSNELEYDCDACNKKNGCEICDNYNFEDDDDDDDDYDYDTEDEEFDIKQTPYVPDCLVLKITDYEKYDKDMSPSELKKYLDMRIFVLYDSREKQFVIRGKRAPTSNVHTKSFSYECRSMRDVRSFIHLLVSEHNVLSLELYNMTDLPLNSNSITYSSLQKSATISSLIVAYDNEPVEITTVLSKALNSLKYVSNVYPEEEEDA